MFKLDFKVTTILNEYYNNCWIQVSYDLENY